MLSVDNTRGAPWSRDVNLAASETANRLLLYVHCLPIFSSLFHCSVRIPEDGTCTQCRSSAQ